MTIRPSQCHDFPVGECWRDHCGEGVHKVYDGSWFENDDGPDDTGYYIYQSQVDQMWVVERALMCNPYDSPENRPVAKFADEQEAINYAVGLARDNARTIAARVETHLKDYADRLWANETKAAGI